jgi:MFS family permease
VSASVSGADGRWRALGALFLARAAMAFQFQSVAALAPGLMAAHGVGLGEIGVLIGLYLAPGLVIALPGGGIGARFGARRVVAFGLVLMLAGGAGTALAPTWEGQIAARVVAGTGGVLLNVLMSAMVAERFSGREIATAMAVFVNSWPVGIAAALLVLPRIGGPEALVAAQWATVAVVGLGLAAFLLGVPRASAAAPAPAAGPASPSRVPRGRALAVALLAGAVWGLYNGALGMVFSFGPALLAERGATAEAASATTSLVLWVAAATIPLGGLLADRTRRPDTVMVAGLLAFALLLIAAPLSAAPALVFAATGLAAGLPAGPIMSLPAALPAQVRTVGLGLFFTLFYAGVVAAPAAGGALAAAAGTAAAAYALGAAMLLAACAALAAIRRLGPLQAALGP